MHVHADLSAGSAMLAVQHNIVIEMLDFAGRGKKLYTSPNLKALKWTGKLLAVGSGRVTMIMTWASSTNKT